MNKAWSHLSVFDLTFQIHTHFELTGCTADLFFFDSAKSWSMRLNPVACETNILYNKHCAWLRLHHDIHSIHIYIYLYMIYVSTILFNIICGRNKKTNITEEYGIFVHPSKHHQNSAKQSVNDMWDNHIIGILTSLHPSRSQKHTYTKHWKDIAKTEVKQWVFTWKEQDPEMILLQLGAKAGSLQRSPVGASYKGAR